MPRRARKKVTVDITSAEISDDEIGGFLPFLRPDNIADNTEAEITSPAMLISSRFGMHRFVNVRIKGAEYSLRLNKISLRNLVQSYGRDTAKWVGKRVVLAKQTILGKTAIIVNPVKQ